MVRAEGVAGPGVVVMENRTLILDLVEWVGARPRTYAETLDAWRTSCPRLTIWEDAIDLGLVRTVRRDGAAMVEVTQDGSALLQAERPIARP